MNNSTSIQDRTKLFGIRIIKASQYLIEQGGAAKILANQLLRSGTSIGANSHEAQSAQSTKDFINKLEIALKEARECEYFLYIIIESELVNSDRFKPLLDECDQLIRILVASVNKAKNK
jgi:four helix bundle protein